MIKVKYLIFRNLTQADFFNINKPRGAEFGGGGQSYIDFPVDSVSLDKWYLFFENPLVTEEHLTNGPNWLFNIRSLGLGSQQQINIYQRRQQSISIAAQKITSNASNRVHAWLPEHGFPIPLDPNNRNSLPGRLCVFIIRSTENEYWAGWFQDDNYLITYEATNFLVNLLENTDNGFSGFIELENSEVYVDENFTNRFVILNSYNNHIIDEDIIKEIDDNFAQDMQNNPTQNAELTQRFIEIRQRNQSLVRRLKELYGNRCQLTGERFTFRKVNGEFYSEAHHLIPLGENGSDSADNLVIVSPLIHKMLHYGNVEGIDLSNITGELTLEIRINGEVFTITWNPDHRELLSV